MDINIYDSLIISEAGKVTTHVTLLPVGTDPLNAPDHALSHRVFAHADISPDKSCEVDEVGNLNVIGDISTTGSVTATAFKTIGGTSVSFVKADGSLDSNTQSVIDGLDTNKLGPVASLLTGAIDGSNTAFTFTNKPRLLVNDGIILRENKGWTWSAPTATMDNPPAFDLFAI